MILSQFLSFELKAHHNIVLTACGTCVILSKKEKNEIYDSLLRSGNTNLFRSVSFSSVLFGCVLHRNASSHTCLSLIEKKLPRLTSIGNNFILSTIRTNGDSFVKLLHGTIWHERREKEENSKADHGDAQLILNILMILI